MQEIPVQSKDRDPDGVLDKLYVVHQFVAVQEKSNLQGLVFRQMITW